MTSSDAVNIAKTQGNKSKAAGGAAGLFVVSGLLTLGACSWAASKIVKNNDIGMGGWNGSVGMPGKVYFPEFFFRNKSFIFARNIKRVNSKSNLFC